MEQNDDKISKILQVVMNKAVLDPEDRKALEKILKEHDESFKNALQIFIKELINDLFGTLINTFSPDEKLRLQLRIDQMTERGVDNFLKQKT